MADSSRRRVLAAADKFRGTATATQVVGAIDRAARGHGWTCQALPMSDGGEGLLDALGGANRSTHVTGPLGTRVLAPWRYEQDGTAVIETAYACGLEVAGGAERNDPLGATTRGVGELVVAAVEAGARRVVLGLGGSATTDGGRGAVEAIGRTSLAGVQVRVCCDVDVRFTDAARVFAPQKGADRRQVAVLTARLRALREAVLAERGVDLDEIPGSGAAGGLAGGLAAVGARLVSGLDAVARVRDLDGAVARAHLVVTGEGRLDRTSLAGKVVGGVLERARRHGRPVLVVAGRVDPGLDLDEDVEVVDLTARFGKRRSMTATSTCVEQVVRESIARRTRAPQRGGVSAGPAGSAPVSTRGSDDAGR